MSTPACKAAILLVSPIYLEMTRNASHPFVFGQGTGNYIRIQIHHFQVLGTGSYALFDFGVLRDRLLESNSGLVSPLAATLHHCPLKMADIIASNNMRRPGPGV